jgi:murein DD-endopeptidase MepM/ murein hydrolase activator NlpD
LTVNSQPIEIYRFTLKNGDIDYFTEDGWSVRKALMKTPIDGARMSSGFGMRHHPILGYNKMHKGADFAAPTGTPIYAAGDGTLEHVGRKGAYGNYIRIRHNSTLKTAYAHLNKFAKGMSASKRVKQGQIIGYVGTTGRSTGPHLHYEVLLDGKQVNPNRIDLPTGEKLKGTNYANLQALIKKRQKEFESMVDRDDLAKSRFNAKEKNSVQ